MDADALGGVGLGLFHPVVRGFLGDDYVVDVALAEACGGDPQEPGFLLEFADVAGAAIAHAGT